MNLEGTVIDDAAVAVDPSKRPPGTGGDTGVVGGGGGGVGGGGGGEGVGGCVRWVGYVDVACMGICEKVHQTVCDIACAKRHQRVC